MNTCTDNMEADEKPLATPQRWPNNGLTFTGYILRQNEKTAAF